MFAMFHSKAT